MKYILLPFVAWLIAGSCKYAINYFRVGSKAKALIGYGGFPSTHTTVLSSVVSLCAFENGTDNPLFSLALASLVILVIDAHGLRRKVGEQAAVINKLILISKIDDVKPLREKMEHSWLEIFGGLILGTLIGYFAFLVS